MVDPIYCGLDKDHLFGACVYPIGKVLYLPQIHELASDAAIKGGDFEAHRFVSHGSGSDGGNAGSELLV